MSTPFSQDDYDFTQAAHAAAQKAIYLKAVRKIFPNIKGTLLFEETAFNKSTELDHCKRTVEENNFLDAGVQIDWLLRFKGTNFEYPLTYSVQERFRKPSSYYEQFGFQDVTLTACPLTTSALGEISKICADYFVYGYYDPDKQEFTDAVVVKVRELKGALMTGYLKGSEQKNDAKQQLFYTFKLDDLRRLKLIAFELNPPTDN